MAYLIERKAQVLYITASLVKVKGKKRKIVIESRPEYAVITLQGLKEKFPISLGTPLRNCGAAPRRESAC